jgi:integrase
VLDNSEAASLLRMVQGKVQGKKLYYPILVGLSTGMRRGEVYALRWKNVDLHKGLLRVVESLEQTKSGLIFKTPKSAKGRRSIALSPVVVQELRRHKREQIKHRLALGPVYQNNDLVFPRADGTPWPPDQVSTLFRQLVRGTALEWANLHTLRHTHATELLREGIHPKVVSERLGHSTVALTLDVYSHVMPSMQDDAARALDATLRAAIKEGRKKRLHLVCKTFAIS